MNNVQYEDLGRAGTRESRKDGKPLGGEGEGDGRNEKEENQKVEVEKKSDISKKRGGIKGKIMM